MKILYHQRTKSRDGQAVHIRELIAALRARGHRVEEWAVSQGESGAMGSEGGLAGRLLAKAPRALYEIGEHAYGPLVAGRLTQAGRALGAEVVYERYALGNTAGLRAARRLGVPLLLEVNSPLARERAEHEQLVFRRWAASSERRLLQRADRVLCVTRVLADLLLAAGVPRPRLAVVRNGVDLARYPAPRWEAHPEVVIGFTGFFRPWHRIEDLVEALADGQLPPQARLLLVGDGPSRASIEARAAARGVSERVRITGAVAHEEVPALVSSMDICVQPASTPWASPLKLPEYMAAGRAVVAPDQPNLREVLTHGKDGWLFPPDAPQGLARAVAKLAADAALRQALGQQARATIEQQRLTWDGVAERVEAIAQSALAERRGAVARREGIARGRAERPS
ncbi:MAG: glycosyltransferase family 4 protein [Planctomycetota bacterium]